MQERNKKLPGDLYNDYDGELLIYLGQNVACSSVKADAVDTSFYDVDQPMLWEYNAEEDRY